MQDLETLSREGLIAQITELMERIVELEEEIARLKKDPPAGAARSVPAFVKANATPKEKKPRTRREHNAVRPREVPTEVVKHTVDICPDCGSRLSAGWRHSSRQVIDIPAIAYTVTEHWMMRNRCGACDKVYTASPDLSATVLGQRRIGLRLMSFIADCKITSRMPIRTIQSFLLSSCGLQLSAGEIAEVLHAVADAGRPVYDDIVDQLRESSFVHADETSWREDGVNGFIWSVSTPGLRYYHRNPSRGHHVPEAILGEGWDGILVSDFYCGYNYHLGKHQRCWVHLVRDLNALSEAPGSGASVQRWVSSVKAIYYRAKDFASEDEKERRKARFIFQTALEELAVPYAEKRGAPQRILAQRITRFSPELFTFVEYPEVPPENNPAERAIRPAVIDRKVTGGTRSAKGSRTRDILRSLFATWQLRGLIPREACLAMLQQARASPA